MALVVEMMDLLDEDGSGEVTYEEWVECCTHNDEVWSVFQAISPLTGFVEKVMTAGKYVLPY